MKAAPVSKQLSQASWAVVKQNRSLLSFTVIGIALAAIPFLLLWVPAAVFLMRDQNVIGIILVVLGAWGVAFAVQLALAALVIGADEALHGRPVSVGACFGRAMGRFGALLTWSGINALMQLFAGALQGDSTSGGIADMVVSIVRVFLGALVEMAWRLISFLVVPLIVLESAGPVGALKESFAIFRQHWGTQIKGFVRISIPVVLWFMLPGLALLIGGLALAVFDRPAIGIPLLLIGVILLTIGSLLYNTVRGVFSVVLYRFLKDGQAMPGFTAEELQQAVVTAPATA